jgi:4-hydroxy-3-polyprenylbenzoate decarboxylase
MPYDLRNFIDDLKKGGELVEVDREVDWDFEIPALELLSARIGGPALLFNKIKGCPETRVLVGQFAGSFRKPHKRIAIALGINPNLDRFHYLFEAIPKFATVLRPVEVAAGACKEALKMGKDVNLFEFPFTYHAIGDGGRYILQNCTTVKDPDSDWINTGNYGAEIYSRNRLAITAYAHTNFCAIYTTKYEAREQSMPVAVCLGGDPAITMAASCIMPPGISEYDCAGGLRGTPVELIRAETSDLLVPADAEMIIEGEIRPHERLPEGPRPECFGFSTGPRQLFYAMRVGCITHRNNPVIYDIHASAGSSSDSLHHSFMPMGAYLVKMTTGMPFKMSPGPLSIRSAATVYCSVKKKPYPGFMTDLIDQWIAHPAVGGCFATSGFVDDDVNAFEWDEIFEAIYTQTNPARDVMITPRIYPTMTVELGAVSDADRGATMGGTARYNKVITDATTKEEPPLGVRRTSFETLFPNELQKWVVDNWQRLGFPEEVRWSKPWIEAEF